MNRLRLSPQARTYLYGVALAALPLLIAAGIVSKEDAPLWIAFLGAILVPGVAFANRPTKGGRHL